MTISARYELLCHPASSYPEPLTLQALLETTSSGGLKIHYIVTGQISTLLIPKPLSSEKKDFLWEHTCFEIFIAEANKPGYIEFNFSPSGQWAGYGFSGYRTRCIWSPSTFPLIQTEITQKQFTLSTELTLENLPYNLTNIEFEVNLATILESVREVKTYWALRHPKIVPDFHDRHGFVRYERQP